METRLGGAQVLELEASHQVVRQDTDLLPGAVGSIVVGGDHIQSKLPFDFGESFLLGSTSGNKPHRTQFISSLIEFERANTAQSQAQNGSERK